MLGAKAIRKVNNEGDLACVTARWNNAAQGQVIDVFRSRQTHQGFRNKLCDTRPPFTIIAESITKFSYPRTNKL